MDVITPPPRPSPPPPHRAERQMQVEAGMCRKSSWQKYCKKPMRNATHTHRKTPTKTMRHGELSSELYSAARRLLQFFARKHRKNRCKTKRKFNSGRSIVPKLEFQHMPAKKSHHPARRQTHVLPRTTSADQWVQARARPVLLVPAFRT